MQLRETLNLKGDYGKSHGSIIDAREKQSNATQMMVGEGAISGDHNRQQRRLDLPVLYGEDPIGLIFRAERYFAVTRIQREWIVRSRIGCSGWRLVLLYTAGQYSNFKVLLMERF